MEFLQEIEPVVTPALCIMLLALAAYLVLLLRKASDSMKAEADNHTVNKYIDMAFDAVEKAVKATAQTFVDALKAEGAFTREKQLEAFNKAKETALAILGETAVAALREIYGDFDVWLNSQIETVCREIKYPDTTAAVANAAMAICDASVQMLSAGTGILIESETEAEAEAENEAAEDPEALHDNAVVSTILHDSYE